jgi:RNA polymerase sigma factor (sigma-70 family)
MEVELPPFQAFMDAHRDDVYRFLVACVGAEEADDCFQETFLSALRAYPRLDDGSNLRAWILTIAHRKAIDAHRSRKRRPVPAEELPERASEPATARDT